MVIRVGKFLLALLTVIFSTTSPTNSNVSGTKLKGDYYFKPVKTLNYIRYSNQDVDCLAKNIYFEAGV